MSTPPPLPGALGTLAPVLDHYGYLAVAGLILLEDFGVPVPGETVLIAAAVYAGAGRLSIIVVVLIAVAAAVFGDNIGYAIGRFGGRRLVERFGRYLLITPQRLDTAERFFSRHGGKVVTIARFVEGLRQANGIIAGTTGMMGWQFTAAEFLGGPIMIVLVAMLFRVFVRQRLIEKAREQADKGLAGSMEGHAAMDMSIQAKGSFWQRLFSADGFTAVAHVFIMEWAAILRDLVLGLLIAGAIGAWVPESFWRSFFLTDHPVLSALWGPIVGPIVAIVSFVCSIGNVPLAAVLWNGGISFGGVIAFIYSDLLILPILNIYRKYYGVRMALVLLGTFFTAMVAAGYVVELFFGVTGLIPTQRSARVVEAGVVWNYTTWLNIAFLVFATMLVIRFVRTGGIAMLRMMGGSPDAGHQHGHRQP